jgi:hypothetical protein
MFLEEENLVTEEVTENVEETTEEMTEDVEQTTEQVEEMFTASQVDEMIAKKLARKEAKIRKEFERKYGRAENVVKAGLGVDSFEEGVNQLEDFYKGKGIEIPSFTYSDRDVELLARAEADEIISTGLEEVIEEVDRLADIGVANMTPREKATFQRLAEYRQTAERKKELAKIGVSENVYTSNDFKDFASKFNANVPIADVYRLYEKTQPKPKYEQVGSMKSTQIEKIKEHYTDDEISRMTLDDLDDPNVWAAVRKSMTGQN